MLLHAPEWNWPCNIRSGTASHSLIITGELTHTSSNTLCAPLTYLSSEKKTFCSQLQYCSNVMSHTHECVDCECLNNRRLGVRHPFSSWVLISFLIWWKLAIKMSATPLWSVIVKALTIMSKHNVTFEQYHICNPLYSLFKKNFCNQSSHYENYRQVPLEIEAITCLPQNWNFSWWAKIQRKAQVSSWRMQCMHSGMEKGTSQAEAMSNSKKIKPVTLAIVKLRESEGISQSGS